MPTLAPKVIKQSGVRRQELYSISHDCFLKPEKKLLLPELQKRIKTPSKILKEENSRDGLYLTATFKITTSFFKLPPRAGRGKPKL